VQTGASDELAEAAGRALHRLGARRVRPGAIGQAGAPNAPNSPRNNEIRPEQPIEDGPALVSSRHRKSGSHKTRRWREQDSNSRSPVSDDPPSDRQLKLQATASRLPPFNHTLYSRLNDKRHSPLLIEPCRGHGAVGCL
jgi:hypothetical protein